MKLTEAEKCFRGMLRINRNRLKPKDMTKKEFQEYRIWARKQLGVLKAKERRKNGKRN